jgi:hypothetical protein
VQDCAKACSLNGRRNSEIRRAVRGLSVRAVSPTLIARADEVIE